jgi:homogentisate 1,2-dioxygenase
MFYLVNTSMIETYFYATDSERLLVSQLGKLRFVPECGAIAIAPRDATIVVIGISMIGARR